MSGLQNWFDTEQEVRDLVIREKLLITNNQEWSNLFAEELAEIKKQLEFKIANRKSAIQVYIRKESFKFLAKIRFDESALNLQNSSFLDEKLGNAFEKEYPIRIVTIPQNADHPVEVFGLPVKFLRLLMMTMRMENSKLILATSTITHEHTKCCAIVSPIWRSKMFLGDSLQMKLKNDQNSNFNLKLKFKDLSGFALHDMCNNRFWNGVDASCLRHIMITSKQEVV